jgi:hypothetical protein
MINKIYKNTKKKWKSAILDKIHKTSNVIKNVYVRNWNQRIRINFKC